jgi:zinc and cadmium transporter
MATLAWIIAGGVSMSVIALLGAVTMALRAETRERLILPLVAFSAGSLMGGAFLHMIPEAVAGATDGVGVYLWVLGGFSAFFALEQFIHWHHWDGHESPAARPLSHLMVLGDGLHNFLGGLAVAGAFLVDVSLGITTWIVAAAHEVPQELGKYGVLLHAGHSRSRALLLGVSSSLTFLLGGVFAYAVSFRFDMSFLVPFAAGNFLYIAASDLVPEVNKHHSLRVNLLHFGAFSAGIGLLFALHGIVGR